MSFSVDHDPYRLVSSLSRRSSNTAMNLNGFQLEKATWMLYRFILTMSLRILIECIINVIVLNIERITIDDASLSVTSRRELTRMWHELGLWLRT
jgi:hypothetical protein